MSASWALASKKAPLLPGTRIMSPNEVMITSGCLAMKMASSTRPMDHAHRAAGPVHQGDALGQVVLEAVLVDGVGVASAHLHELVLAAGLAQGGDLGGQGLGLLGVAELVDEAHRCGLLSLFDPGVGQG